MKLISFETNGVAHFGLLEHDKVYDPSKMLGYSDIKRFISGFNTSDCHDLLEGSDVYSYSALLRNNQLLPAIPNPNNILCIGLNYEEHRVEARREKTKYPTVFIRTAQSQVAHGEALLIPRESIQMDFEGEIAVIIGKAGRRICKEDAHKHVFGFSCYNDASVRDWQSHTTQWTAGKNFPGTGAFGPFILSRDELDLNVPVSIETRVNHKVVQSSDTSFLIFSFDELIAYLSTFIELQPGDVIVSGTPGGVGFKRTPPLYLQDGDLVEVEVGRVGVLSNKVINEL